jgi:hypothetical protein
MSAPAAAPKAVHWHIGEGKEKMRVFLFAVALLAAASSVAIAGPKDNALEVVARWNKAFAEKDVDGITKLYAPDALFLGTGSKRSFLSRREFVVTLQPRS